VHQAFGCTGIDIVPATRIVSGIFRAFRNCRIGEENCRFHAVFAAPFSTAVNIDGPRRVHVIASASQRRLFSSIAACETAFFDTGVGRPNQLDHFVGVFTHR
jgi:hypothetical protein